MSSRNRLSKTNSRSIKGSLHSFRPARNTPCRFFMQGYCRKGDKCDFPHPQNPMEIAAQPVLTSPIEWRDIVPYNVAPSPIVHRVPSLTFTHSSSASSEISPKTASSQLFPTPPPRCAELQPNEVWHPFPSDEDFPYQPNFSYEVTAIRPPTNVTHPPFKNGELNFHGLASAWSPESKPAHTSDRSIVDEAVSPITNRPCRFFWKKNGCRKGDACDFSHDPASKRAHVVKALRRRKDPVPAVPRGCNVTSPISVNGKIIRLPLPNVQLCPREEIPVKTEGEGWRVISGGVSLSSGQTSPARHCGTESDIRSVEWEYESASAINSPEPNPETLEVETEDPLADYPIRPKSTPPCLCRSMSLRRQTAIFTHAEH